MRIQSFASTVALAALLASPVFASVVNVPGSPGVSLTGDSDVSAAGNVSTPGLLSPTNPAGDGWAILNSSSSNGANPFATGNFLSVLGGGGFAEFAVGYVTNTLSFYWGTPDLEAGRNLVTFFKGNVQVGTFDGSNLVGQPSPFSNNAWGQVFKAVITVAGGFDSFRLSDSQNNSFEVSHLQAGDRVNVPGPIAGAGLPFLIAGAAMWMRRRNRAS